MRSSEFQIYMLRYGALLLGLVALGQVLGVLAQEPEPGPPWGSVLLAALLLTLFVRSRGRFGVVTAEVGGLFVQQNGERFQAPWKDVVSFHTVGFLWRPIYRLTFVNRTVATYFIPPPPEVVEWPIPFVDQSGMGNFIRSKLIPGRVPEKEPARWRHDL